MHNITDDVVECVKAIVDNNRCETCDIIGSGRLRHQCGHHYCNDCVAKLEHCLLCLTPPGASVQPPLPDGPAELRAANAAKLLNTFQHTFNVDVYKRSRISEQLKTEKELFPDCIQAPLKYYNKRKSSLVKSNKENSWQSFLPGELISPMKGHKMENSLSYVQHWLDNSEKDTPKKSPRKAFADLDINTPDTLKRRIPRRADLILSKAKETSESTPKKKKVSSFKSSLTLVKKQLLLDKHLQTTVKEKQNTLKESPKRRILKLLDKTDNDESGIVIDDGTIIIDDSQSQVIDKDELAWRAVLEAEEKSPYISQCVLDCNKTDKPNDDTVINKDPSNKVPFFKRSYLTETCRLCNRSKTTTITKENKVAGQPKDVSITIESSSFSTTIKVLTVQDRLVFEKRSVPTQTDVICDLDNPSNTLHSPATQVQNDDDILKPNILSSNTGRESLLSQDLFTAEVGKTENQLKLHEKQRNKESALLTVEESDSDDAAIDSSIVHVIADVHRSSELLEPEILAELEPSEINQRVVRNKRSHSPNSSDSSEKENFDPNRQKKLKLDKKDTKKVKI